MAIYFAIADEEGYPMQSDWFVNRFRTRDKAAELAEELVRNPRGNPTVPECVQIVKVTTACHGYIGRPRYAIG